ncbi:MULTISPECIES: ABC-three component system middle component 2 [Agrobacterium]|uniref:ABC-three component system middle component 2 n=1 Tax=Agrobacterium TaxID=357 RepID=UPI001C6F2373|nr:MULTISPECIES: ABC-three component system middle component 2 [Agrobacterium]MBW9075090.1 threonine transporter [Agrobacterium deltaense]UNZ54278.1 threonine transporter [Agrobacterium tumefaciens]
MDEVIRRDTTLTFNGPLEAGVRAVAILGAAFPRSYDLHRLTALDYLLVHTHQLGGPDDLHPSTPIQTPATEVRRNIIQDALQMMMTKDLVRREINSAGITYCAGETAAMFLDALRSPYLIHLKSRANWLTYYLADYTDSALDDLMRRFFDRWVVEFQDVERSLGADR